MSRRVSLLGLLPVFVLIAACGSAKPAPAPVLTGSSSPSTGSSTPTRTPSARPRTTATSTAARVGGTTNAQPTSTSHPTGGAAPTAGTNGGGATNARVPATFVIRAGSRLDPPSVSAPAFLTIQLTAVAGDGKPHRVSLRTPAPHLLSVPAHGRASVLVAGLRAGRYGIVVDGVSRGTLMIGGEPGP